MWMDFETWNIRDYRSFGRQSAEEKEKTEMNGKYIELERCDFKCLDQCIRDINSNKSRMPEKKEVKYKCKRDDDALCTINKMLEDIEKNKEFFDVFDYGKWHEWKRKGGIDLDDSNRNMPNPYIRSIYYILWGKRIDNGWGGFSISCLFPEEKLVLGGDTMNTIASYISKMENFMNKSKKNKDELDEFCRVVHQLGNFVLVPAYFNRFRGFKGNKIYDCMDSSLYYLKNNDFEKGNYVKKYFNKYINIFFLWDYVYVNNNEYYVSDLKLDNKDENRSTSKDESQYKITEENAGIYIKNAKAAILRRSIFMEAMLMLAVEFKGQSVYEIDYEDKWPDWSASSIYKYIVEKVFLTDKVYKDFAAVIEEIKRIIQGGQYKEVLNILNRKDLA